MSQACQPTGSPLQQRCPLYQCPWVSAHLLLITNKTPIISWSLPWEQLHVWVHLMPMAAWGVCVTPTPDEKAEVQGAGRLAQGQELSSGKAGTTDSPCSAPLPQASPQPPGSALSPMARDLACGLISHGDGGVLPTETLKPGDRPASTSSCPGDSGEGLHDPPPNCSGH